MWSFPKSHVSHWSCAASPRRHELQMHCKMHLENGSIPFLLRTSGNLPSTFPLLPQSLSHCFWKCLNDGRSRSVALRSEGLKQYASLARPSKPCAKSCLTQRDPDAVPLSGRSDLVYVKFCASIFPAERNAFVIWSMRLIGTLAMHAMRSVTILPRTLACLEARSCPSA